MELIDRQDAITAIDDMLMEDEQYKVWLKLSIKNIKPVDAIPIEWIEKYVESKTALLGDSELWMKWMIDEWQKEQEKQK